MATDPPPDFPEILADVMALGPCPACRHYHGSYRCTCGCWAATPGEMTPGPVPGPADDHATVEAMITRGGSFVQALGRAWMYGDHLNRHRIRVAFPEIFAKYVTFHKP